MKKIFSDTVINKKKNSFTQINRTKKMCHSLSTSEINGKVTTIYEKISKERKLYLELKKFIENKNYESIKRLFDQTKIKKDRIPNINHKYEENNNDTALYISIANKNIKMIRLLIDLGADLELKNNFGHTALHRGFSTRDESIISLLISAGGNINATDNNNETILMKATSVSDKKLTEMILLHNADVTLKNRFGETCFDLIPSYEMLLLYRKYFSKEVIQNGRNHLGRTIFNFAKYVKHNSRRDLLERIFFQQSQLTKAIRNSTDFKKFYQKEKMKEDKRENLPSNKISLDDFEIEELLGKGGFGEVYKVKMKSNNKYYALKTIDKKKVMKSKIRNYVEIERNIYSNSHSPFIVKFYRAFQSTLYLYLLIEYMPNGDLKSFIKNFKTLPENEVRLIAAQIILAIEHLHYQGIIYRDLKPDNILFDSEGYVKLTDFGLCKAHVIDNKSCKSFCGSLSYLPPEILDKKGHGRAADWYCLGTVIYEMLNGIPPYFSPCGKDVIMNNIRSAELTFNNDNISDEAKDLIRKLMCRNIDKRLGSSLRDSEEIKSHKFFKEINFEKIYQREFIPGKIFREIQDEAIRKHRIRKERNEWYCNRDIRYKKNLADGSIQPEDFGDINEWTFCGYKNEK